MSTQTALNTPGVAEKRSLVSKLKIPGLVLGIVGIEWLIAYLVMPSTTPAAPAVPISTMQAASLPEEELVVVNEVAHEPEDAHGHADKKEHASSHDAKADKHGHGDAATAGKPIPRHSDAEEVDLGSFTVSGFQPASNSTLFITFHLYGTVRHKYVHEFSERLTENQHRIRDNVIVIIRSAEITDLTDAGLGLIKRRILETTNKTLGKPLLQEVVFSDFSFIEQ